MRRLGPILTREDIPAVEPRLRDVTSVFNPGAIRLNDRDYLLLRVQTRGRETVLMVAERESRRSRSPVPPTPAAEDGFVVRPEVVSIQGLDTTAHGIFHVYDPRLTLLDGAVHVVFAVDCEKESRLGMARTVDMKRFDLTDLDASGDRRNGVLFPETIGGKYLRLERPNRPIDGGPASGSTIEMAESENLRTWRRRRTVLDGRPHYWDERIGPGPPPIKTRRGWLLIYHGVATHFASVNIYQAGAVLLQLDDPSRVLARTRENLLEPREPYELTGQVPNVVFPTGILPELFDAEGFVSLESRLSIYYGAADTCVAAAEMTVEEILENCVPTDGESV